MSPLHQPHALSNQNYAENQFGVGPASQLSISIHVPPPIDPYDHLQMGVIPPPPLVPQHLSTLGNPTNYPKGPYGLPAVDPNLPLPLRSSYGGYRPFEGYPPSGTQLYLSGGIPPPKFQQKLKYMKEKMKKWSKESFGDIFKEKEKLELRLKEIQEIVMKNGYTLELKEEEMKTLED